VTRRINEVDKISLLFSRSFDVRLVVKRNTSGFDGDTSFLLVLSSIGSSGITSRRLGNDTGLGDKGVSQSTLSVVNVSNDGHVPDLVSFVLSLSDLIDSKVWHIKIDFPIRMIKI
jgi:hypothetical protein